MKQLLAVAATATAEKWEICPAMRHSSVLSHRKTDGNGRTDGRTAGKTDGNGRTAGKTAGRQK